MWHRADRRRRGMTTLEVLIASTIASMIFIVLGSLMVTVARGVLAVNTQARRQAEAGLGLDRCAEILRNAVFDSVSITNGGEQIEFTDARTGATSRISVETTTLDDGTEQKRILYLEDTSGGGAAEELAYLLAEVSFESDDNGEVGDDDGGAMVVIQVEYTYQSFRDRLPDESRNALFQTVVFLRNT